MTHLQLLIAPELPVDPAAYVDLARELTQLLRREFTAPVTIRSERLAVPRDGASDVPRGDPVAVAALILSIPSAAVAIHDLAGRLELKHCLQRVVLRARACRARATWRIVADQIAIPGDRERTLDEIIDELSRVQDPPQTG